MNSEKFNDYTAQAWLWFWLLPCVGKYLDVIQTYMMGLPAVEGDWIQWLLPSYVASIFIPFNHIIAYC